MLEPRPSSVCRRVLLGHWGLCRSLVCTKNPRLGGWLQGLSLLCLMKTHSRPGPQSSVLTHPKSYFGKMDQSGGP